MRPSLACCPTRRLPRPALPGLAGFAALAAFATGALLAPVTAASAPVVYDLDPAHSFVHFEVEHFGTSTVRGRFGPVAGTVELDREARRGRVALRIATAGVDTGYAVFNARLREDDLLSVQAHPEAFFVAEGFRFDAQGAPAEVRGEFTLRGVSQPLSLHARFFGCRSETTAASAHTAARREICGGEYEAELNRSEFGATFGLPFIADRVRVRVQVEAVRR
ncbi:MAG: YceI family protein [Burkholderiales bacterium]|nr:YceI family protein [Burkholderiales bacterium]